MSLRTIVEKTIDNPEVFKNQLLHWAQQFREVIFLDSNKYHQKQSSFDFVLAVDAFTSLKTDYHNAFEDVKQYQQQTKDWLFGYLSYDVKNDVEELHSNNFDGLHFPDLFFFQPKKLLLLKGNQLEVHYLHLCNDEIESDLIAIENHSPLASLSSPSARVTIHHSPFKIQQRISKESYIAKVNQMLEHIHRG